MSFSLSHTPSRSGRKRLPVALAGLTLAVAGNASAVDLTGNAALTSDYVWRGSSQSDGDPAAQAGFKLAAPSGLYASLWGSSVEFAADPGANTELDAVLGWSGDLAPDWALDASLTHYRYPSAHADLDWTEAGGVLTWKKRYWAQLAYSNDALATGESGTYAQLGAKFPLGDALRIEAAVGRYFLADAHADSYTHAQLGAVWAFNAPFELRVTAHATDGAAKRLFPDMAGSRVEAALQVSF